MSAIESSILSSDAYVESMLRAAEAQSSTSKLSRRTFLKVTGLVGGGLVTAEVSIGNVIVPTFEVPITYWPSLQRPPAS